MSERPLPVVVDTDGGVDDCTALWWALTSGDVDVRAVTTVSGNVSLEQATRNVAKVLHATGRTDVPVATGARGALGPAPIEPNARHVHGDDGLGGAGPSDVEFKVIAEPAFELIAHLAAEQPGELTLAAVGPLTNVARALHAHPHLTSNLGALVVMGGAVHPPGNVTPLAEFNIACDPVAAADVARAAWARPPLLVPLDVTYVATLGATELELLSERRNPAAEFLAEPIAFYRRFASRHSLDGGCPAHDLVALLGATYPELLRTELRPLAVDTGGSAAWGATVVDFRPPPDAVPDPDADPDGEPQTATTRRWRIALEADVAAVRTHARVLFGGS